MCFLLLICSATVSLNYCAILCDRKTIEEMMIGSCQDCVMLLGTWTWTPWSFDQELSRFSSRLLYLVLFGMSTSFSHAWSCWCYRHSIFIKILRGIGSAGASTAESRAFLLFLWCIFLVPNLSHPLWHIISTYILAPCLWCPSNKKATFLLAAFIHCHIRPSKGNARDVHICT